MYLKGHIKKPLQELQHIQNNLQSASIQAGYASYVYSKTTAN